MLLRVDLEHGDGQGPDVGGVWAVDLAAGDDELRGRVEFGAEEGVYGLELGFFLFCGDVEVAQFGAFGLAQQKVLGFYVAMD